MAGSGAGALYVGPGWDGAFLALDLFLRGEVAESSSTATSDEIAAATEVSLAQFAPDLNPIHDPEKSI